ncbi:MAG: aspartate/glutamate racemase family protein [Coprothermobacterota bacterium]|nr:aspartate/glutamate racemase family protein [Coprothermobacterota bacterium]
MKILVINPNTSASMTEHLRRALMPIKRPDTELSVICPEHGPITIECEYDEVFASAQMLPLIKKANEEGYDAVVIACFSDPGITAAREISTIPVLGIQETTLHVACMLGAKFTIITNRIQRIAHKQEQARKLGLESKLASVRALGLSVAEADAQPARAKERIIEASRRAIEEDGAEVIVLGCAGMAGYAEDVERALGVVVLDPSSVALKVAEAFADLKLRHAHIGLYAPPPEKEYN